MSQPVRQQDAARSLKEASQSRQQFDALYREYAPVMLRAAWQILKSEEQSWDVVQRAFVKLMERPERLEGVESLRGFMATVARNGALDVVRRRRPQAELDPTRDADPTPNNPAQRLEAKESMTRLDAAMRRLSDEEREILRLKVQEGFEHTEIAEILGKNSSAVRVALHRARKKLEEWMGEDHDD